MAAVQGMRFIPFVPPNPSLSNRNKLRSATVDQSIPSLTSCQKRCRPAAVLPRSGGQSGAERNVVARTEGWEHAVANNDDGSDDDLPSLEELLRIPPSLTISDKASGTEPASQHLDQPALNGAIQADRTKSETGEHQGDSSVQSMTFDDESEEEGSENEAEDGAGDIEMGHTERDASPQSTFKTSDLISRPTKSVSASGPWFDVEEGRFIDEPELFSIFPPVSKSLPDHSYKCVGNITTESANSLASLLNGNNGWTDDSVAELEAGVELALSEGVNSSPTSASSSPRHSVDPPQDKTNTQEYTETTSIIPEELQGASLHAIGLEKWEQQRTKEINPLPRSVSLSSPSSPTLLGKTELENPRGKRGRKDTYRETSSERLLSADSVDACDKGDEDLPIAKRRKSYEAPALIASPHFRRPPSSTSLEMDDTQPQANDGRPSISTAIEERFSKEDEEFNELAMDDCSQQGNDTDGPDDSADEDYTHETGDEDEEDIRPTKPRASFLPRCDEAPRYRYPPASTLNEQLHTPRHSRSPSTRQESQLSAGYREWSFGGSFKSVRIGSQTTFNLEFTLDDLDDVPEQLELSAAFKAIEKRLSLRSSANTRAARITTMPPKNQHRTSCSPKKRNPWTVEEDALLKKMREEDDCSWEEISVALPLHTQGSIEFRYSKKFSGGTGSRKRQRL